MAKVVLVIGKSGSGKSASLRNFKKDEIGVINVLNKPLPFKNDLTKVKTDNYDTIKHVLKDAKVNTLVIDDAGYLITNEFMRRSNEKGYQKFTDLGNNFFSLIQFAINEVDNDKIIFMNMHEESNDLGEIKPKTIGKLLDEKVCIEGMFTIVLRAFKNQDGWYFRTQSNGFDISKSPMGMFESDTIENDLKLVAEKIREYYDEK